jgi:hypothetical protein
LRKKKKNHIYILYKRDLMRMGLQSLFSPWARCSCLFNGVLIAAIQRQDTCFSIQRHFWCAPHMTNLVDITFFSIDRGIESGSWAWGQEMVLICDEEDVARVVWQPFGFLFFSKIFLFHYEYFYYLTNINHFFLLL